MYSASSTASRSCSRQIRDDGPLARDDDGLIEAQESYAAALSNNVQMVLMLSSMLHSIGVGTCCRRGSASSASTSTRRW